MIPLVAFDSIANIYLTVLFLLPLKRELHTYPAWHMANVSPFVQTYIRSNL
jgi:hypothetical protein